jgi:segregation and condensation protein A
MRIVTLPASIMTTTLRFRVELDVYRGPIDLLLYLVRHEELEATEIAVAAVTEQFLGHMAAFAQLDVDSVGDFLEMASLLIEIKSRMVLPGEEEVAEELDDPRQELVRRLLEYKQYRDAASMLEERSRQWSDRYPRLASDLPSRPQTIDLQPIGRVELWDLVSAFGRVLKEKHPASGPENIRYDETPIHVYMQRIHQRLRQEGRLGFTAFLDAAVHRSTLVGMFLAVLELVRHHHAQASQPQIFGEIWLEPGEAPLPADLSGVADYEHGTERRPQQHDLADPA